MEREPVMYLEAAPRAVESGEVVRLSISENGHSDSFLYVLIRTWIWRDERNRLELYQVLKRPDRN